MLGVDQCLFFTEYFISALQWQFIYSFFAEILVIAVLKSEEEEIFVLKGLQKRVQKIFSQNSEEKSLTLNVQLDEEAGMRLKRLKAKMPRSDENQMVNLALKCLAQKWNLIVKRQAIKSMNLEQIARRLNDEHFPTPTASHHWSSDLILDIQKYVKEEAVSNDPIWHARKDMND